MWPSYRWQLSAGLYSNLDTLPSLQKSLNARVTAGYHFRNGASIRLHTGIEQYQTEIPDTGGGLPGGGMPPGGSSQADNATDRMFRIGLDGSVPVSNRISLFGSVEGLRFNSETSSVTTDDFQVSGGVRFSIEPRIGTGSTISPVWNSDESGEQEVRINFSGEGRLYLVGDFNNWERTGIPLRKQSENTYVATLSLSPGAYEYKLLHVQGNSEEWMKFADDVYTVDDGFESENAMLLVE